MKTIVVSAVNITEGGPLTIFRECMKSAALCLSDEFRIVAIVNSESVVDQDRVETICIPSAKKSWFIRLYWEWIGFYRLSKKLKPFLWFSLHDITPRVLSSRQAVYCHNPSPFFRPTIQESLFSPTLFIWSHLYMYLYRAFIKRNHFIIVQQEWVRKAFLNRLGSLPIVVAYPSVLNVSSGHSLKTTTHSPFKFFYPAFPRVFKNIQILCSAAQHLLERGFKDFQIILTIDGRENRYSKYLYSKYSHLPQVIFSGVQGPGEIKALYQSCDAVVFPSKLETWGLPITEAKLFAKPLLVADLPYAHETVGDYSLVSFFPPDSFQFLSLLMEQMITRQWTPTGSRFTPVSSPFTSDWNSVWSLLVGK
jgi:glycosyltransferase involved in cell wall biosynthesis